MTSRRGRKLAVRTDRVLVGRDVVSARLAGFPAAHAPHPFGGAHRSAAKGGPPALARRDEQPAATDVLARRVVVKAVSENLEDPDGVPWTALEGATAEADVVAVAIPEVLRPSM